MPLHVTHSTVGREAPLATVPADTEQDQPTRSVTPAGVTQDQTDSASISDQGQRLAALGGDQQAQLRAIAEAEQLAKSLAARMAENAQSATAAHGAIDPARVAQLLDG